LSHQAWPSWPADTFVSGVCAATDKPDTDTNAQTHADTYLVVGRARITKKIVQIVFALLGTNTQSFGPGLVCHFPDTYTYTHRTCLTMMDKGKGFFTLCRLHN